MQELADNLAFPNFGEEQLNAIAEIAEIVEFQAGEALIRQGQKDYPFLVVISGTVRIVERDDDCERLIAMHGSGGFIGDVDILTGRSAIFSAIATERVEAYRLSADCLRKLLRDCPAASETLLEAFQQRRHLLSRTGFLGVRIIGTANSADTARIREFFYKNHVPATFFEVDSEQGQQQLNLLKAHHLQQPVVHCNGKTLEHPTLHNLAHCIGISREIDGRSFDLAIVGSGPAGLAAAVYAASEGIRTLVIDRMGPGGQAASSSRIENFIGFPSGLSGRELAGRGYLQALKFGAEFVAPLQVKSIDVHPNEHRLNLDSGETVRARCVLVTSGVSYRQLDLADCQRLEGAGVYYAATQVEARVCEQRTAVVVGGGNSAGQAAMFLADHAKDVKILIRGSDLTKSMSAYLCERIAQHPKIEVLRNTELHEIQGKACLESIVIRDNQTQVLRQLDCSGLFLFIGAKPHTDWLPPDVLLDDKGFILTGAALKSGGEKNNWPLTRPPCDLETSVPGIMAAGDVRSGTTKRCGFAVGDGSLAVACVHRYLNGLD